MNKDQMTEALRKSIDQCGIDIVNSNKRLKAILNDFLPGVDHKFERKFLLDALELDEWRILLETHDKGQTEHTRAVNVLIPLLENYLGWTEERSMLVLQCYTTAMGWKDVADLQLQSQDQPKHQPKKNLIVTAAIGNTLKFGMYEWRVLDVQGDRTLIISKDVTHKKRYNETKDDVTWETCTLRKWLNEDFLGTFNREEQSRIILTTNLNENNQWYDTAGGNQTQDRIFLLSISEVIKYFGDSGDLTQRPNNKRMYQGKSYAIVDEFSSARISEHNGSRSSWWLRSSGYSNNHAVLIDKSGDLGIAGLYVSHDRVGAHPALWLNL
jgi:hypothetical protein